MGFQDEGQSGKHGLVTLDFWIKDKGQSGYKGIYCSMRIKEGLEWSGS